MKLRLLALALVVGCGPNAKTCVDCQRDGGIAWYDPQPSTSRSAPAPAAPVPTVTGHPRLLVREADLERLRGWATSANPIYAQGLEVLARESAKRMDAGELAKDPGGATTYTSTPTEGFAELFAFMSLVAPAAERDGWARRARTCLMAAIDRAAEGVAADKPFRAKNFSINDRSRWHGEGFALTVDWIYGALTAEDKAKIRKVFLRWADEIEHAETTNDNHPEPFGLTNDPRLLADKKKVRWAANNYYAGHLRNLGLSVLALDPADDPDGKLRAHMKSLTGAWLYVSDALMRGDMAGGMGAEGFEYSPQSLGYVAMLLSAMATSGTADAKAYGPQVTFENPFWKDVLPAYVHSLSPATFAPPAGEYAYLAPLYSVAWYGDGDHTWAGDPIGVLGPLAIRDRLAGDEARLGLYRWLETNVPHGGAKELLSRARDANQFSAPILYFMLFDPQGKTEDPRPGLPLTHFAPGLGRILARTSWTPEATWFTYKLSWSTIDHQHTDGNMFELYRKGEWLIKERTGYGIAVGCSDQKNSVAIENDRPVHDEGYRKTTQRRGSQWLYVADGDPTLRVSLADDFVAAEGEATPLYNSSYEKATDVLHASRSIVWLKPDRVVVYDRAATKSEGRFKRFFLNFTGPAKVEGTLTTMTSPGGQKLFVRTLSPGSITVEPAEPLVENGSTEPAKLDPVKFRLKVEDPARPKSARFLHVLSAGDANATADAVTPIQGAGIEGVVVADVAVVFPVDLRPLASVTYTATAKTHLVTGLQANAGYKVTRAGATVTLTPGGDVKADAGGVLALR